MKIVLLGYMGCGKSVIGDFLAKKVLVSYYDLDDEIERITQSSITKLFQSKGEIYFRKKENEILKALLSNNENFVLSLGGGTPCYYNNHELIAQEGILSIYLKVSVDTLANRLIHETEKRPLLHNQDEVSLKDFISKHLFDRNFYYHQATKVINVDNKTIEEIVKEIEVLLA
jgi:shikimate kinase